jgi:hypothetical protein
VCTDVEIDQTEVPASGRRSEQLNGKGFPNGPLIERERDILPSGGPMEEVPLVCWGGNVGGGIVSMPVDATVAGPVTSRPCRSVTFPAAELDERPRWYCEGRTPPDHDERSAGGNAAGAEGANGVVELGSKSRSGVREGSAEKGGPEGRNAE